MKCLINMKRNRLGFRRHSPNNFSAYVCRMAAMPPKIWHQRPAEKLVNNAASNSRYYGVAVLRKEFIESAYHHALRQAVAKS